MPRVTRIDNRLPQTWEEALTDFLLWKQAQKVSSRTLRDYREHIMRFFRRFPDAYNPVIVRQRVLEYMAQPDLEPASFNLRRVYLKVFFAWCVQQRIFPENPLDDIPKKHDPGRVRSVSEATLQRLLDLPNKATFSGLRDYALILLTLATGIRPGEALSLVPSNVNLHGLTITVERNIAKTREEGILPIPPVVAEVIKKLILARHKAWDDDVPIFCTYAGKKLTTSEWGHRLKEYCRKGQLQEKVTPYSLRHTFAIMTLREGGTAFTVQAMMRHHTMAMTKRYVHLSQYDLDEQMSRANPLNRILPHRVRKIKK